VSVNCSEPKTQKQNWDYGGLGMTFITFSRIVSKLEKAAVTSHLHSTFALDALHSCSDPSEQAGFCCAEGLRGSVHQSRRTLAPQRQEKSFVACRSYRLSSNPEQNHSSVQAALLIRTLFIVSKHGMGQ
jgi:hypothetical protein